MPNMLVHVMDFIVILIVLLLVVMMVMMTLSLLLLRNSQYLWPLFSRLSGARHCGGRSSLGKIFYFDLSFILKALTSPVQQDPCLSSWKWSLSMHGHSTELTWKPRVSGSFESPVTITYIKSVLWQELWIRFMAKARLWLRKIALLRLCCFAEEKVGISAHLTLSKLHSWCL